MALAALLFDLDGTMLDTDPIHRTVFAEMLAPHGVSVDEAFYAAQIHGRSTAAVFRELAPGMGDPDARADEKEAIFRQRLPRPYPAMAGVGALIDRAEAAGLAMAVVTNAMRANATVMLDAIGLGDRFDVVISGEECARGKPAPDPYLAAMETLGVHAGDCIAFEDSPTGIASARAAGAVVIGLASSMTPEALRAAGAHRAITDFTDPALDLDALVARQQGEDA